ERAKSQLKVAFLLSLDGTTAVAEDIGKQLMIRGQRFTPRQIENAIDAVSTEEIKRVAQRYLWDKDVSWFLIQNPTDHTERIFCRLLLLRWVASMAYWITIAFGQICHP